MEYRKLLEPLRVAELTIPNRIVMPPLVTFLSGEEAQVSPEHVEHYRRSSGPGLMIVEATAVLPEGRLSYRQLGIYRDQHVEGLARLAETIHASGAVAGIQIHHAGEKTVDERWRQKEKKCPNTMSWELKSADIERIKEAFVAASRRTVEAGYDMVEFHSAHGYLLSQLLSPLKNQRNDRYGGSLENRQRLLLEVFRTVRDEVGDKILVTCRLGVADGEREGFTLTEGQNTSSKLAEEGVELLDVSCGLSAPLNVRPEGSPYSPVLHLARAIKDVVPIPVIGVGGIRHPDLAEQAIAENMADLIAVGKGILADPAWASKVIEGKPETIAVCRQCKPCFHFTDPSECPTRKAS